MPVQIIEANDPITAMVQFRTSAIYEMLVSLHTLLLARRHHDWIASARTVLGADFMADLSALYEPLCQGSLFFEMAVDYKDHEDVPSFIDYIRTMDAVSFTFYLLGRLLTREQIAALHANPIQLCKTAREADPSCSTVSADGLPAALADIPALQRRLVSLWQRYWDGFFNGQVDGLRTHWQQAITEKQRLFEHLGGSGLLEAVTGKTALFHELPAGTPVTELVFVPLFFVSARSYIFYGYGNETVLFDSERTEARASEIDHHKERALEIAKALSDGTRLNILRLIADHPDGIHGKRLAIKLNLSASAVSRQLAQLRDSGLIIEEPHDDQTVTYRLIEDTITSLPRQILDYLYS